MIYYGMDSAAGLPATFSSTFHTAKVSIEKCNRVSKSYTRGTAQQGCPAVSRSRCARSVLIIKYIGRTRRGRRQFKKEIGCLADCRICRAVEVMAGILDIGGIGQMHPASVLIIVARALAVMAVAVAVTQSRGHLLIAVCQEKSMPVSIMVMTLKHCHAAYQRHQ